jgi:hypothetical protein
MCGASRDADAALGPTAVAQVQKWGGVLEQPADSRLWAHCGLPKPGEWFGVDALGGMSIAVEQCAWGHVARKRTWLYIVGVPVRDVLPGIKRGGTPTHWVSGGRGRVGKKSKTTCVPPGIKVCSAQQRRRTPLAFAEWLIDLCLHVPPNYARPVDFSSES